MPYPAIEALSPLHAPGEARRGWRRTLAVRTAAVTAAIPLVAALCLGAASSVRLLGELTRIRAVEAEVTSRWLADRLERAAPAERSGALAAASRQSNAVLGLFDSSGRPLAASGSKDASQMAYAGLVPGTGAKEVVLGSRRFLAAAARLSDAGLVVAAVEPPRAAEVLALMGPEWVAATLAVVLSAIFFGFVFGADVSGYLNRLKERLDAMVDEDRPLPEVSEETTGQGALDGVERAMSQLEMRFRSELVLYRDALEEVRYFDARRSAFLGAVARELRAPLNAIVAEADRLLGGSVGPLAPAQADDMRIVGQAARRLRDMVDDAIDLSALASQGIEYDAETVDLVEVAREVVETARGGIGGKPLSVRLEPADDGVPRVRGSRRRLWQIATNLVSNAVKFTDSGQVAVRVDRTKDGGARLEVSDTGSGIPEQALQSVFDPFNQRGEVAKRRRGTGLGLAIVKQLVDLHHGRIEVQSVEGKGSRFIVILPGAP